MPDAVLILTATIRPPADAPGVARLDPKVREQDYLDALDHYIDLLGGPIDRIVFAENSGADLSPIVALAARRGVADRVAAIQTDSNDFPADYGRCYGEITLLDRAMAAPALADLADDTIFWKSTGRYKIRNLAALARTRPAADLYIDLRLNRGLRWADLRTMSWTREGYREHLSGIAPELREDLRDGRPGEEAAYDLLHAAAQRPGASIATCFRVEPIIDGVRAFDNQNWSAGRQRLVAAARDIQRRLLGRVIV